MTDCRRTFLGLAAALAALLALGDRAPAALTYTIGGNWDSTARRDAAEAAAQAVLARYNAFAPNGFDNRNVYIYYDPGIPTAQASYHGSIGFGGTWPNERVTQHELGHYLGLPYGNKGAWDGFLSGGAWSGAQASALVRQFEGDQATLNGDGIHFWPYGLNFDNEFSALSAQRQVAMVYAMRADMGIGPAAHPSAATTVTLTANDPAGTSGFNYQDRWSDGYFAHAGAAYRTGDFLLRTPSGGNSFTFAGDSLTVNNTNATSGGLVYQGAGTTAVTTIDNLRLSGGWVQHASGDADVFQLAGRMTVVADSTLWARRGDINILADVAGGGDLTIHPPDSTRQDTRYVRFQSPGNTFTGSILNNGRFELGQGANFRFAIGGGGASNAITGATALATRLNGTFDIDLAGATSNPGDSWALVTAANANYGATFNVAGFDNSAGVWSNGDYSFSQATGLLTLVTAWATDGSGAWSNPANWTGGVPISGGDATLGNAVTATGAPATVNLDAPVSLNRLTIDNAHKYIVAGGSPLTLVGGGRIAVKSGGHEIAAPIAGTAGLEKTGAGALTLAAANSYAGDTHIRAGTLALTGGASIAGSANIHVHPGATLDVSGTSGAFTVAAGQTLHNNSNTTVVGDVTAAGGSVVAGVGTFANGLNMQAGARLQIGGAGMAVDSQFVLVDNFDAYDNTFVETIGAHPGGDVTGGAWDGVADGTGNARIVDIRGANNAIRVNGISQQGDPWRGAVTNLAENFDADHSLADGDTATYFFQVRRDGTGDIDGIFGLADQAADIDTVTPWNDYAITASLYGTSPQSTSLRAYDSQTNSDVVVRASIANQTWYNVWLVVDNDAKTFDIYTSTGTSDAEAANPGTYQTDLHFGRDLDVASLVQFGLNERLSNNDPADGALRMDNIYVAAGENIANPLGAGGGAVYAPDMMVVLGDLHLATGASVAFDVAVAGVNDRLIVGGELVAGGALEVSQAPTAPALVAGDSFDLFDFASASGAFDSFSLPGLAAGLAWNVSQLTATGELSVAVDVDLDDDGWVTGDDLLLIQRTAPTLVGQWQTLYGAQLAVGGGSAAAVPEPSGVLLAVAACGLAAWRCSRRRSAEER